MLNVKCQRFIIWSFSLSVYVCITRCSFLEQIWWGAELNVVTRTMPFKLRIVNLKWWFYSSNQRESSLLKSFVLFLIFSLHSHGHLYLYVFIHFCSGDYSVCSFVDDFLRYLFWFLGLKNFWHNQLITEAEEIVDPSEQIYYVFCFLLYYIVLHWEMYHKQRFCVN